MTSLNNNKSEYVELMGLAVEPSTLRKYTKAYNHFISYCSRQGLLASCAADIDKHLMHYVQHLYDSQLSFDMASCAIYGVQHFHPWLADKLRRSKLALKGWKRAHPSESHPPLTWELTCLLATWLTLHHHHDAGLAVLVGFDCYLRIGEILGLKVSDIASANDPRLGAAYSGSMLRLAKTKTGRNQSVTIENPSVARLLARHLRNRKPSDPVFSVSKHSFYTLFHKACKAFGLDDQGYSPHSLRHGGATRHHMLGRPIADIQLRGRWSDAKSVRIYIQSGRALLLVNEVDPDVFAVGAGCAQHIHLLLEWLWRRV